MHFPSCPAIDSLAGEAQHQREKRSLGAGPVEEKSHTLPKGMPLPQLTWRHLALECVAKARPECVGVQGGTEDLKLQV